MLRCMKILGKSDSVFPYLRQGCASFSNFSSPLIVNLCSINDQKYLLKNDFQKRHYSKESSTIWTEIVKVQHSIFDTVSFSTPVQYAQEFLVYLHGLTGLEWGPTIVLSAFLLRFVLTLPLNIYQQYVLAKFEIVVTEKFPKIVEQLKQETAIAMKMYKWDNDRANFNFAKSANKQYKKLIVEDNCHPAKASLLVLIQIPLWVSASFAIRNLTMMRPEQTLDAMKIFAEISTEKFLWLNQLMETDDTFFLPIIIGVCNLAIIEMQILYRDEKMTKYKKYSTNVFRLISVCLVPLAASVPSVLSLYWASSTVYGLGQNILILSPKFKKFFKIPFTKKTRLLPYRHIVDTFVQKVQRLEKLEKGK